MTAGSRGGGAVSRRSRPGAPGRPRAVRMWSDLAGRPGALNMAIDQALLARVTRRDECWLRLYRWSPNCLSFGRHEPALRRYDRGRITEAGLDVVRRPTGGRAVWHAGELTYAVALPAARAGDLRAEYHEIHRMLVDGLARLGIPTSLAPPGGTPGLDAGACFARPVGGEILLEGRKVVGSAQVREAGGVLQHGSILLQDDQSLVGSVTIGPVAPDGSAPLDRLLGRRLEAATLAGAVTAAAASRWGGSWCEADETAEVLAAAEQHLPRFASAAWTWQA